MSQAKKAAEEIINYLAAMGYASVRHEIDAITRAIERHLSEEWIPCEERLPEEWEVVITVGGSSQPRENYISASGKWKRWADSVTHWHNLPAPPEKVGG